MITKNIYNNLLSFILLFSLFAVVSSIKTYQVRRVNDSTFLVTSLPYFDFHDVISKKSIKNSDRNRPNENEHVINLNGIGKSTAKGCISSALVHLSHYGNSRNAKKKKMPSSEIMKARDDYFHKFYPASLKNKIIKHHIIEKTSIRNISPKKVKYSEALAANLQTARTLAKQLISSGHDMERKQARRRRFIKKVRQNKRRVSY